MSAFRPRPIRVSPPARPVVASIDLDSEIPRLLAAAGAGIAVAPDDVDEFVAALAPSSTIRRSAATMGAAGRDWAERAASPAAVGAAYDRCCATSAQAAEG